MVWICATITSSLELIVQAAIAKLDMVMHFSCKLPFLIRIDEEMAIDIDNEIFVIFEPPVDRTLPQRLIESVLTDEVAASSIDLELACFGLRLTDILPLNLV